MEFSSKQDDLVSIALLVKPFFSHFLLYSAEFNFSSNTKVDWSSFCREVCIEYMINNPEKIGGKNVLVEIDESKFGSRKYLLFPA